MEKVIKNKTGADNGRERLIEIEEREREGVAKKL